MTRHHSTPSTSIPEDDYSFNLLFRNHPIPMWICDLDNLTFLEVNNAAILKYGYSIEEFNSMSLKDIRPENEIQRMVQAFNSIPSDGKETSIWKHRLKNGNIIDVEITSHAITYKGKNSALVLLQDITDRIKTENALRKKEEHYRLLVENQTDLVVKVDLDGRFLFVSPTYCKMFGKTEEELIGNKFMPLVHEDDQKETFEAMRALYSHPYTCYLEQRAMTKDGWRWLGWADTAILNNNNEVVEIIGVGRDISERKEAEAALKKSESVLRVIFDTSPVMFWYKDTNNRIIRINPAAASIEGKRPEEIEGKTDFDLYPFEQAQSFVNDDEQVLASGLPRLNYLEEHISAGTGEKRWLQVSKIPTVDENGTVQGMIVFATDITESKLAQEASKSSEEKFSKAFHSNSVLMAISRIEDGLYLDVNDTFLSILNFNREEVIGHTSSELGIFNDPQDRTKIIEKFKSEGSVKNYELIVRTKTKEIRKGLFSADLINVNGETSLLTVMTDITERLNAEQALKESEARFRNVVKNVPVVVYQIDLDGIFLLSEGKGLEKLNLQPGQVVGLSIYDLYGNLPQVIKAAKEAFKGKASKFTIEVGDLIYETFFTPILNNEGVVTSFIGISFDITERIEIENELRKAKEIAELSNKVKDGFMANISHEIRTPLNGILGMASLIKESFAKHITEEEEDFFKGIDRASNRIIRTIDMILDISRLQAGDFPITPKIIGIDNILHELTKEYQIHAKSKSLILSFENQIGETNLFIDEYSLTHAISNLIDNAIKYTKEGFVKIILYADNNSTKIDVTDSGIGISKEYQSHLFNPYTQEEMGYGRAYDGVGLGLSLVKRMLDLNNAKITVKSEKNIGTTFTIIFSQSHD